MDDVLAASARLADAQTQRQASRLDQQPAAHPTPAQTLIHTDARSSRRRALTTIQLCRSGRKSARKIGLPSVHFRCPSTDRTVLHHERAETSAMQAISCRILPGAHWALLYVIAFTFVLTFIMFETGGSFSSEGRHTLWTLLCSLMVFVLTVRGSSLHTMASTPWRLRRT